jgi:hypothetical protein
MKANKEETKSKQESRMDICHKGGKVFKICAVKGCRRFSTFQGHTAGFA